MCDQKHQGCTFTQHIRKFVVNAEYAENVLSALEARSCDWVVGGLPPAMDSCDRRCQFEIAILFNVTELHSPLCEGIKGKASSKTNSRKTAMTTNSLSSLLSEKVGSCTKSAVVDHAIKWTLGTDHQITDTMHCRVAR